MYIDELPYTENVNPRLLDLPLFLFKFFCFALGHVVFVLFYLMAKDGFSIN